MIVVKNVELKEDRLGRKSMVATGPLEVLGCWPIDGTEVDGDVLKTAYATSSPIVPEQNNISYFPAIQEVPLALHLEGYYNRGDKKAAVVPLPIRNYVRGKEFAPSQEFKKLNGKFNENTRGLSNDKKDDVLRQMFSAALEGFNARIVMDMTSDEVDQKIQGLAKKRTCRFRYTIKIQGTTNTAGSIRDPALAGT